MPKPYWKIFLQRLLITLILVFATYNLWGLSYAHWVFGTPFEGLSNFVGALKILVGLAILVGFGLLFRATWRAKGPLGIVVTIVVSLAFVWLLYTLGWIDIQKPSTNILLAEIILVVILTLGSTWSILWKRLFGQYSVEDPDTTEAAQ